MAGVTFQDFQEESPLTLGDFKPEPDTTGPKLNDRTVAQLAASDTVLTAGTAEDYRQTKEDLLDPETRQNFLLKHSQIRDAIWNHAQGSLVDLLSDPSVSDAEKMQGVVGSKITVDKLPPMSTMDTLAEEAAIADSGEDETDREAEARYNSMDTILPVNKQKRELTIMLNSLELGKDATLVDSIVDVGELMLPFAEWIHTSRLQQQVLGKDDKKALLLGQQKKAMYDKIQLMSVEDRGLLAERLIQIVQDNDTIVFPDGNDLSTIMTLHRMLINNDYSDTERYIDNIISILDVSGLATLIFRGAKTAKAGAKASKLGPKGAPKGGLDGDVLPPEGPSPSSAKGSIPDEPYDLPTSEYKDVTSSASTVQERRALTYNTHTDVVPSSPSQVVKDVNPDIARKMNEIVENDDTGEAALALYGTNKTEALANDLLPVPVTPGREMPNKVEIRPYTPEPPEFELARTKDGNIILNDAEFARLGYNVESDLRNIEGMILHPSSMVSRVNKDGTIGFTARYSFTDVGFRSVTEAYQNAEFAFRKYGLQRENFTLLSRQGDQWVPIKEGDIVAKDALTKVAPDVAKTTPALRADNEFAIGIDYNYRFSAEDIPEVDLLTTAPGYIARIVQTADRSSGQLMASAEQGSLVQHLLDAASVIHPQILNAASVAVDKTYGLKKLYVDEFIEFGKQYKAIKPPRRALVTDYIHQANLEGIKFSEADLRSRGFNKQEIKALKKWRRANDIMWYAANDDMAKTLRGKGYETVVHHASDTKLVGRPVALQSVDITESVYDPLSGTNIKIGGSGNVDISLQYLTDLYEKGGKLVRLAHPIEIDGKMVDLVLSRNSVEGGFTRRIYDGETVLAYRDGYYPVGYEANYFIDEVIKANGREFTVARATARDTKEAKEALRLLRAKNPDKVYNLPRQDRSIRQMGSHLFDEGHWSLSSSSGLTTQRFRGKRLADPNAQMQQIGTAHLKDPLEAVAQQIHALSQRVSMRTFMDTAKRRWIQNYGQYLELPRNKLSGQLEMPAKPSQIVPRPGAPASMVADARTNYNYLYGLENGYISGIDKLYRSAMFGFAEAMAEMGFSFGERFGLAAGKINPTQILKTQAFRFLLAAAAARQAIIQRGQIILLLPVNVEYFFGGLFPDLFKLRTARLYKALGMESKIDEKTLALLKEVEDSGILEAVDAHNLIRTEHLRLADLTWGQTARSVAKAPLDFLQKVGFDSAEQDNLLAAWLTFRDKATKAGTDVSKQRARDTILGKTRDYTLHMNRAGEQPYSQNTFGLFMQFFAFSHKSFLQPITNRNLTPKERATLLAYSTFVFGIDTTILYKAFDAIWGDEPPSELKDIIKNGMLDTAINYALSMATGTKQDIDFSDLAPSQASGMFELFKGMLTTNLWDGLASSPALSMYFGSNPRITNMVRTWARYFNVGEYDAPELQATFKDVIIASLSVYSGFSSIFKANYAFKFGQKLSSYGRISDADVTKTEALAQTGGFSTRTETGFREAKAELYGDRAWETDDVKKWYLMVKQGIGLKGKTVADAEMFAAIAGEAWSVFAEGEGRSAAVDIILDLMNKDAANGDTTFFNAILNRSGFLTEPEMWQAINKLPDGNLRKALTDAVKEMEKIKNGDN